MKKNILIVTDYSAVYEGNFIRSIKALEKRIENEGNKVFYLLSKSSKNLKWVTSLKKVDFLDTNKWKNIRKINQAIAKNDIGIVYTHFCYPKTQFETKIACKMHRSVKLFSHFHNHYIDNSYNIKDQIVRFAFDGDKNIGCSKSVMESLPFKKRKNCFVCNRIDFSRFNKIDNQVTEKLFEEGKCNILMFGYTPERKGVDIAISAIKRLNRDDINLYICISKKEEELRNFILEKFEEIPSFVKIIEPTENVEKYYKSADLFISPSREEGFCYAIIESAYCGCKLISSDITGIPKDIPGNSICESENVNDFSNKIQEILEGKVEYDHDKIKNYLDEIYNIDIWCDEILQLMKQVN